ncbi:hypothetical protein [Marmoricola sp. URHB0036]|uniref:hypothetical protein n=1 Tax=Marmoricola sp. URHB0036 TaxID=1298863 RepID=UPI000412B54C|nr:hypothetical protein [Marmoricola sp. URHB0036]
MRPRAAAVLTALTALFAVLVVAPSASAQVRGFPGFDCKESPTPDMPASGLAAFFDRPPSELPPDEDPFAKDSKTTIYEQYGYAGLRWHTYDLGCGPDLARHPDAVIGTAIANWIMIVPIAFSALTSSITRAALHPTFLRVFDPVIERVSSALHDSLFASWVPVVIALLGIAILFTARKSALATTAASIGWALLVVLVATAIFRWPLTAGHFADSSVTGTLGSVVSRMQGSDSSAGPDVDPGVAVASNVQESIFYRSWLAGTLGSTDSRTARKYGPLLFKSQALTWREAAIVQKDPSGVGKKIIETKQDAWAKTADAIKAEDPAAYEFLTGQRSETRFGYAVLALMAAFLALPFLLAAALLLIGSFLIVRLAVMMFPAFATIGLFPAGRGVVLGVGRTVGAALVNSVVFGIGAAVTIRVLGLILDPASDLPGWLTLVLLPLFSFVMWVGLRPFRRLTSMVSRKADPFGDAAGAVGASARNTRRGLVNLGAKAAAAYTGNVAALATAGALDGDDEGGDAPDRAEAHPGPAHAQPVRSEPLALSAANPSSDPGGQGRDGRVSPMTRATPAPPTDDHRTDRRPHETAPAYEEPPDMQSEPLPPTEPEWVDGEEVYPIYRPTEPEQAPDDAA